MFLAGAKVMKLFHSVCPEGKIGPTFAYLPSYPRSCKPEDMIAAMEADNLYNYYLTDIHVLGKYPKGVRVEDCAKVTLSEDLSAEDIMEKLHIVDCAMVICTKEQEEAVNMIAEDVAMIQVSGQDSDDEDGEGGGALGMLGSFFGKLKDTQIINAAEYEM